jgi:hypothetical protein
MLGDGYVIQGETARPGGRFTATVSDLWRLLTATRARKVLAVWMFAWILLWLYNLVRGNAHDQVVGYSMFICAGTTVLVWAYRDVLAARARKWAASPRTKFIVIGSLGAAFAEYVFWQIEKIYGITGVAANPNLAIDLLVTMPWYIMMVALLWKVQTRYRYSFAELFVLGGVYELGADGLVGSIMNGTFSAITVPSLIVLIPFFSLVYAVMVIPASAIMKDEVDAARNSRPPASGNRNLYAMLPWLGLAPYFVLAFLMRMG